ncbi:ABC1 kinase family protein [Microbacterium rhizosphaerae]|uniref:AarF/ABC1/UbiB kinase family protein n=1 Tax=Microbacterium rhizosphaerae TaxID=1678237 RepID=A0ABZ0SNP3_9MICO|nr:AarF/ABC1/UbiB kinase family protein [Microbacterium rhizosphaerae]WPR90972.1 AarF/ABC1/UbiB kinase family protein [Microbacterium rhizosphaerae]
MPDDTSPGTPAPMRARYRRILRFASVYIAEMWWYELVLPRIGFGSVTRSTRTARLTHIAQRFRVLATELGGLMIKVGQFLSSRLDVLPPEITNELSGLQDEVPGVPYAEIRALAEAELGVPLDQVYTFFSEDAVAAASLGQAHRARLATMDAGFDEVIVKVQRPRIEQIIDVDLAALRRVAGWLNRVRVVYDHVDLPSLVEEFAATSLEEIDYLHEAASAERFAEDFADDPRVGVPQIAWERTTRRVLTLSDVTAIKISDVDALRAAGIDPSAVARAFAEVMFEQLFDNGFFHADPHPGNIFVLPLVDGDFRLDFIDFGMMGTVPDQLRNGLRRLLVAVASRDGRGLVESIREVGVLLPSADTVELERAVTGLFSRFGGMGFAQLREVDEREFRDFGKEFGDVVRSLPFQLPENFLLVIRAMSLTSGVCSTLDPEFNIWDAVEPFASRLLSAESGKALRDLAKDAGMLARLPKRLDGLVARVEEGRLSVTSPSLDRRIARLERMERRIVWAVLFAGLLIAGAVLLPSVFGIVLMSVSVLPLLPALFGGLGARRR